LEINRHVEITTGNLHGGGYDADINSTESVMSKPKSRRIPHPLWFGIVAVLMVVLCVVLSVWIPYQKEQIAIRKIERLGGSVEIHQGGSDLLREVGGADWIKYDRVSEVEINDKRFGDEELKHLSYSTRIFRLSLNNTSISDEGLKHISGLTNLSYLYFYNTQVSDERIKHLSGLTNLKYLFLEKTRVSDKGLKHLSGLTKLKILVLSNTQVSDEGIKHLSGLTNLKFLVL
jgi:hypothetical protein